MPTIMDLHQKLSELSNPDEIAAVLEEAGSKGRLTNGFSCPIARYLQTGSDYVYPARDIAVGANETCITVCDAEGQSDHYFEHTIAMTRFIEYFDGGGYPNLIQES